MAVNHEPRRGDEVEAWIRRKRDELHPHCIHWDHLDDLLDDYRLHADTGTPLDQEVSQHE